MNIYLYDKKTLEYVKTVQADPDPEETKIQGHFVPLLPAFSTIIAPPDYGENEIPIFNGKEWLVYPDFRGRFLAVDENLNVKEITTIGNPQGVFLVEREIGEEIIAHPEWFKICSDAVVKKSSEEQLLDLETERKRRFEANFFETSLGWIRRKVSMKDGSTKDFLSDLVLAIKAGLDLEQEVTIITYKQPDFSLEDTPEYVESLQERKTATMDFIKECLMQTVQDFGI